MRMITKDELTDNINHPAHYEAGGYECEKVMEAVFGKEAVAVW